MVSILPGFQLSSNQDSIGPYSRNISVQLSPGRVLIQLCSPETGAFGPKQMSTEPTALTTRPLEVE